MEKPHEKSPMLQADIIKTPGSRASFVRFMEERYGVTQGSAVSSALLAIAFDGEERVVNGWPESKLRHSIEEWRKALGPAVTDQPILPRTAADKIRKATGELVTKASPDA